MADYEKNYYILYNAVTDAIEKLEEVQKELEQEFIDEMPAAEEFRRHISAIRYRNGNCNKFEKNIKKIVDK